ncbi:MAG: adenylate/guanylate cyclase domain-containing protein [Thiotrichales bacterium]|nr:MAG: adenylate/guanylate cyclase domain-containing protein [Thiotrichales bacterium]
MDIQRFLRYGLSLGLTAAFLLHPANIQRIPLLDTLENRSYDARIRLISETGGARHVAIVAIDEKSLDVLGHWPWNRSVLADLVDELFDHYRVKSIGFDIVFAEADEHPAVDLLTDMAEGPLKNDSAFQREYSKAIEALQSDRQFANSLKNRKTVSGFIFGTGIQKGALPDPVASINSQSASSIPFIRPDGFTANLVTIQSNADSGGFFDNPLVDADGVYRRAPMLQLRNGLLYESLALALVRSTLDYPDLELIVESAPDNNGLLMLEWLKTGDLIIPVDDHAGILVPYIGPQQSFDYISAVDILDKKLPVNALQGKIILFGASAPGLSDLRTTPLDAASPGIEIHANIIQGIIDQTVLHRPGYIDAVEFLLLLVLGLVITFLLPLMRPFWALAATTLLLLLLIAANLVLWSELHLVIPVASPVLLVITLFTLHMTYGFFVEDRIKRRLTHLFGRYVPPELVNEMSRNMDEITLDGEIREMSVLFADIRHFTTFSENMDPKELTRLTNTVLTALTEVIHLNRGTIDKYMGDAVMAFWGAPLKDPRHALHALTAAVNMVQQLNELNAAFKARKWPAVSLGIGINSGEMNVGNKGSEFRLDYTIVGDAVNLGSRLEPLTRVYGVDIIAGENTRLAVPEFKFRELDRVRVKGKDLPVVIYEPLGPENTIDHSTLQALERFHHTLENYRSCKWDEAEKELTELSQADPDRMIYRIYLDRIMHFRQQPPPENWDGTFTHTSK